MLHLIRRSTLVVALTSFANLALAQPPADRPSDQPPRDDAPPRREPRRDAEPPPPKKGKELFDRDFPSPRDSGPHDGRPGGDKNSPPKGKGAPGDRRPGEESPNEEKIRQQHEAWLEQLDRNGDGVLDRSEWARIVDPERFDADHNGIITLKEVIDARPYAARGFGGVRPGIMPGPGGLMPGMPGMPGPVGEVPPDDPEMRDLMRQDGEMDRKTHELALRIRESRGDERNKMKAELQELVNKHFDVRQQRRELQLKRMDGELQRLREAISTRNKSRDSIVTNHMKELIGEERDLEF